MLATRTLTACLSRHAPYSTQYCCMHLLHWDITQPSMFKGCMCIHFALQVLDQLAGLPSGISDSSNWERQPFFKQNPKLVDI